MALMPAHKPANAAASELFISEYIEGSSFNKAIEIYNGTGSAVDLAAGLYTLELYSNGAATPNASLALLGTIADGDVYVLAHATADAAILAVADVTNSLVINFNGDDAVVLRKNGAVVDAFGQIGFDPGSEWIGGGTDDTLRREVDVCAGDTNPNDAFDASVEWDVFAQNTFDGLGSHSANCGGTPITLEPKINEFSASTAGTDVEYVEIFGEPNTDYSAYTLLEIEGDFSGTLTGLVDEVRGLGTTDSAGFYLMSLPANALENGTITLLLVKNFSGAFGNDLDTNEDGILDITPWETLVDAVAVHDGGASDLTYGIPVLGPNYDGLSSFAPGGASRIPDGFDSDGATDWVRNDFDLFGIPGFPGTPILGEAVNTPGAPNSAITVLTDPIGVCGDPATSIHTIQGAGLASGDVSSIREIEAVVVATFQALNQIGGYNIQEEDAQADADPLTSEGLRIFDNANTASVGDLVRVRGSVTEFNGLTELTNVIGYSVCETGHAVTPATVSLPLTSVNDFEAFEGMLVTFPQELVIAEYFNFDRFNEIVLTSERHLTPSAEFEPGPAAIQAAQEFLLDKITLDDGRGNQNPDPAIHPNGNFFDLTNLFRGGDTVANVTGVMDYAFGLYRIQPTQGADYTNTNPRTASPDPVGGNLKVASFNVLNYFTTLDYPTGDPLDNKCGPLQNQECRGADDANELTRQRAKIVAALSAIDADVVGLIEIENHPADVPTADLVSGLNDLMGAGTYEYLATGAIGTDAIRQAFIYKPASVSLVGDYAVLDSIVDPRFLDDFNRPVLAQTFMDNSTGGIFTVAVNHLKSKGSDCNAIGDPDLGDGAGNCNLTRLAAAEALVDWLAGDPTGSGDSDYLIIGDLNSYDKEDPIDAILEGSDDILGTGDDYTDTIFSFLGEDAYSYVFDGQIGYLDHALANAGLSNEVAGVTIWHINADEPDLIDYDTSFKQDAQDAIYAPDAYRSSDHDPVIVGLGVCDEIAPTFDEVSVTPDMLWPPNHKYVDITASVVVSDNFDPNPTITLVSVTSNEPDSGLDDEDLPDDIVIVDDFHFRLRAERSENGSGRIYTITYIVTDACGNSTTASVTVTVPHNIN
jgi:hypothetical protein